MKIDKDIFIVLIVLIIGALIIIPFALSNLPIEHTENEITSRLRYKVIYIENMPCLYVNQSSNGSICNFTALTCDWSKYDN